MEFMILISRKTPDAVRYDKVFVSEVYEKALKHLDMNSLLHLCNGTSSIIVFDMDLTGKLKKSIRRSGKEVHLVEF